MSTQNGPNGSTQGNPQAAAPTGETGSPQAAQQSAQATEPEGNFEVVDIPEVQVEGGVPQGPSVEALQARMSEFEQRAMNAEQLARQWQQWAEQTVAQVQQGNGQRGGQAGNGDDNPYGADQQVPQGLPPQFAQQFTAMSQQLQQMQQTIQAQDQRLSQFQMGTAREKIQTQVKAAIAEVEKTHPGLVDDLAVISVMRSNPDVSAAQAAMIAAKKSAEKLRAAGYVRKRPVAEPPPVPGFRDAMGRPLVQFAAPAKTEEEFQDHLGKLLEGMMPGLPD